MMVPSLIVKRTFLEVSLESEHIAGRRERSYSEGASPDQHSFCTAEKWQHDNSSSVSTTEVESSLDCFEERYPSSDDSEAGGVDLPSTDVGLTSPPGQWGNAQRCTAMPVTWYMFPMSSPIPTMEAHGQPKANRSCAAKKKRSKKQQSTTGQETGRSTVVIRMLPDDFSKQSLLEMLDNRGYTGLYDFVYLPRDFKTSRTLGYAIVNMVAPRYAQDAISCFADYNTSLSDSHKGFFSLLERYQESPMMHPEVPDEYKPSVFVSGHRIAYPMPRTSFSRPEVEKILKQVQAHRQED